MKNFAPVTVNEALEEALEKEFLVEDELDELETLDMEMPEKNRAGGQRRKNNVKKAMRKKRLANALSGKVVIQSGVACQLSMYDSLHRYSKNKIHCSCPICNGKRKDPRKTGPAVHYSAAEMRQRAGAKDREDEYYEIPVAVED